ncbi:MAG: hypothetical protein AAB515_00835 [Patescibacteria group bacterium]
MEALVRKKPIKVPVFNGATTQIRIQSVDETLHEECAALMEELTSCAYQEVLDTDGITRILGRLLDYNFPRKKIKECILSRISFQAALNRGLCVETGNLFIAWERVATHKFSECIKFSGGDIHEAIQLGISSRAKIADELRSERGDKKIISEEELRKTLQTRIFQLTS